MESTPLQVTYRAIFTEMLLAQSAAIGAFADVSARCARLAGQQLQREFPGTAGMPPKDGIGGQANPGDASEIRGVCTPMLAHSARACAAIPRISMMVFLSQYHKSRERRRAVRD